MQRVKISCSSCLQFGPPLIAALRERGIAIVIGPFPKRGDQPANAMIRDNAGNYIQIFGK